MMKSTMQSDEKLRILAKNQASIIEDLAIMCRELIDELTKYRNTEEISEELEEYLGRRVKL